MKIKKILILIILSCSINLQINAQDNPWEKLRQYDRSQYADSWFQKEQPREITESYKNLIDDNLIGVGYAKEVSDGASILLAEKRARAKIASNVSASVRSMISDYPAEDGQLEFEEHISLMESHVFLSGSRVIKYLKTRDGAWWCVVALHKADAALEENNNIIPHIYSIEEIRAYSKNLPSPTINRTAATTPDLNEWIENSPKDMLLGLGAAKASTDEAAIKMAKEIARKSLISSFDAEVIYETRDYIITSKTGSNTYNAMYEEKLSVTSKYDVINFETITLKSEKTIDGTWWVLLGCQVEKSSINEDAIKALDALEIVNVSRPPLKLSTSKTLPNWVNNPSKNTEDTIYIVVEGEGDTIENAKEGIHGDIFSKLFDYSIENQYNFIFYLSPEEIESEWITDHGNIIDEIAIKDGKTVKYFAYYSFPRQEINDIWNYLVYWYIPALKNGSIEQAVYYAAIQLAFELPKNKKVVIISVSSTDNEMGEFVLEELIGYLSSDGTMQLYDRKSLDSIRVEQKFQMTGDVDDNSAVSIGKFAGADIVITGNITGFGSTRRLRFKALDVLTASILSQTSHQF